ncbi:MAG: class I SAM-dependent methyltransferase [Pseudomonadota bacterium]
MDRGTIDFYSQKAADYAEFVGDAEDNPELRHFIACLAPGATCLDFGCGHGWAARQMIDAGFQTTAIDASPGLAAEAKARYGVDVDVMAFEALDAVEAYDGLWVSFSLLHDTRAAFPKHLERLRQAARENGLLFIGLKEGEGDERDVHNRLYTYFSESEVTQALGRTGWRLTDFSRKMMPGMAGKDEACLHFFARTA